MNNSGPVPDYATPEEILERQKEVKKIVKKLGKLKPIKIKIKKN